jgi:endonuclease/exonuclease/phosphatase family metal-dependent hydrolase
MKKQLTIISLNIWSGRCGDKLFEFLKHNQDVDIFCLQEVFNGGKEDVENLLGEIVSNDYESFTKIKKILPNHVAYFRPCLKDYFGLALFVRNTITVLEEGDEFVYQHRGFVPTSELIKLHARNIQFAKVDIEGYKLSIFNFHGMWQEQGKVDTSDRLLQSEKINHLLSKFQEKLVVCGDFNLLPETESIAMIESRGLRNLIKENGILSTRTSLYTKQEKFADYVFVSEGLHIELFEVMSEEVSDHSALKLIVTL